MPVYLDGVLGRWCFQFTANKYVFTDAHNRTIPRSFLPCPINIHPHGIPKLLLLLLTSTWPSHPPLLHTRHPRPSRVQLLLQRKETKHGIITSVVHSTLRENDGELRDLLLLLLLLSLNLSRTVRRRRRLCLLLRTGGRQRRRRR